MKNINEALAYEIKSHWLASYISFGWGQEIIAWWIANKVKRKWKRYLWAEENLKTYRMGEAVTKEDIIEIIKTKRR